MVEQSPHVAHGPLQAPQPSTHGLLQAPQPAVHGPLQAKAPFPTTIEPEVENLPPPRANS
jgi:hypothetical protein